MEVDPALLAKYGIDQETFDRLRKTSPHVRAYTREEYHLLDPNDLWRDQCQDQLKRHPDRWVANGFFHVHRPILDDSSRAFRTLAEYRQWCDQTVPEYLGLRQPR